MFACLTWRFRFLLKNIQYNCTVYFRVSDQIFFFGSSAIWMRVSLVDIVIVGSGFQPSLE